MSIQGPLFQPPPLLRAPLSHQMLAQCCSQCLIVALIFLPATFCTNLVSVPFTSSPQSPYILERDLGFYIFISSILPLRNSTKALSWGDVPTPRTLQRSRHWAMGRGLHLLRKLQGGATAEPSAGTRSAAEAASPRHPIGISFSL